MAEFVHIQKNINHSPRKLRLVADMVRKMTPQQALLALRFTNKAAAIDLAKAIKAAVSNVRESSLSELSFKALEINEGRKGRNARRIGAGSRSHYRPYHRWQSHIKIVLSQLQTQAQADEKISKITANEVKKEKVPTSPRVRGASKKEKKA